ncbi:MAG: tRNA glutamyl-Q(34) synthetase GluQRS, partial [Propionibacteriaceae bacterium]|nr:tRNA glutamyl-Q(34) synthetase GluQRS [Propionibacteriaceae bacterium]
ERQDAYARIAEKLQDRLYECFCTRKEIAQAPSAPHSDFRPYSGTCRNLTAAQRAERRKVRPPAWRIRADSASQEVCDRWLGRVEGAVDDFVVRRNDGVWAYNFAVVVDDLEQGVDQVCRGEDLLSSAPRQAWLAKLLGGDPPEYAHVPLVLGPDGGRLQKRDGAVTLADLSALGMGAAAVRNLLARSLGLASPGEDASMSALLERFDPAIRPSGWRWSPPPRMGG